MWETEFVLKTEFVWANLCASALTDKVLGSTSRKKRV